MTAYTAERAAEICERLASGKSLNAICRDKDMPSRQTVHEWIADDRAGFREQYARARDAQADRFAEEILEISDDTSGDWIEREGETVLNHEHVQRSKLRVDTRKWLMARMAPRKYGDKVTIAGDENNPLRVVNRIEIVPVEPRLRDDWP
jgi:hypothetical protein